MRFLIDEGLIDQGFAVSAEKFDNVSREMESAKTLLYEQTTTDEASGDRGREPW